MIFGIGVDMATVSRLTSTYERFGERFARRILHARELEELHSQHQPARFLAKRFAVKEAAVKALGTGERDGVLLKDFFLLHDDLGKPLLGVSGEAERRCAAAGVDSRHVSLTDEGDQVVAFVVLECTHATT